MENIGVEVKQGLTVEDLISTLKRKRRNAESEADRLDADDHIQSVLLAALFAGAAKRAPGLKP